MGDPTGIVTQFLGPIEVGEEWLVACHNENSVTVLRLLDLGTYQHQDLHQP